MFDVGVTTNEKNPQHVALFWDFNCNCSTYLPSVLVTHASGCTSAEGKIWDIYGVFITKISSALKWKLRWTLSYPTLCTSSLIFYGFLFLKTYWLKFFRQVLVGVVHHASIPYIRKHVNVWICICWVQMVTDFTGLAVEHSSEQRSQLFIFSTLYFKAVLI